MAGAAAQDASALADGIGNMRFDFGQTRRVDQRAKHDTGLGAGTHLHAGGAFGKTGGKFFVNTRLHQKAVGANAGLAGVAVFCDQSAVDRSIHIGVVENDKRRIAAELQRHLFHRRGALRHQQTAHSRRAGERELADDRIGRQLAANFNRVAGDDIENARWKAGLLGQYGQRQGGQRRLFGRLDHHRATSRQRRRHLAGDHREREVPRRDRSANANRLFDDE